MLKVPTQAKVIGGTRNYIIIIIITYSVIFFSETETAILLTLLIEYNTS